MYSQLNNHRINFRNLLWVAPLAGLAAAIINSLLFLAFSAAGIISDQIIIPDQGPITIVHVIISSIVPSLLAGLVFAALGKFTKNPFRIFALVASVLVILSFVNPFMGIPGITVSMGIALDLMHIVVAVTVVYMFTKYAKA